MVDSINDLLKHQNLKKIKCKHHCSWRIWVRFLYSKYYLSVFILIQPLKFIDVVHKTRILSFPMPLVGSVALLIAKGQMFLF